MPDFTSSARHPRLPLRQRGQALVFGIAVLLGAAAATFYVFNTGQLTAEKTKLVNTADAVAYSAGVMHARALNFDAYTNRALIANEATIAQMVSISSWLQYSKGHVQGVPPLYCYSQYSVPVGLATLTYVPLCYALSYPAGYTVVNYADTAFNGAGGGVGGGAIVVAAAETAKAELKLMQATMFAGFLFARTALVQEVADANYRNDGSVSVTPLPLKDDWTSFQGGGTFISRHTGNQRQRMRDLIVNVVNQDAFVRNRSWSSSSPWPCNPVVPAGTADRSGGTVLNGYNSWEARDQAHFEIRKKRFRGLSLRCVQTGYYSLGNGHRKTTSTPGSAWYYSGVPDFYELSNAALNYTPTGSSRPDPRLQFAIRVTRAMNQTRTSAGTSAVKPGGRLHMFDGAAAGGVLAAVATSEVYFDHEQINGTTELGSLFNPYWQVHLVGNSTAVVAAATALQGVATP
ncbi:hypothetical protein HAV22_12800 [Massilia sp. TW-1]|uniref:Putative Flp pilus-assembly TadG-like N-terminal domain-containing protein n=1 Tax=Telluria antibiotica TaxID=2717319 RepID=A0ABX0PB37_9BURK|nr:pilus assembly protein TadG-related protein [Telluria antibiotica]NIA54514.1 hypothetical protein [Telluria antibiotica]